MQINVTFKQLVDEISSLEAISKTSATSLFTSKTNQGFFQSTKEELYEETLRSLITLSFFDAPVLASLLSFEIEPSHAKNNQLLFSEAERSSGAEYILIQGVYFSIPETAGNTEKKVIYSVLKNDLISNQEALANTSKIIQAQLLELYRKRIELNGSGDALDKYKKGEVESSFRMQRIDESRFALIDPIEFLSSIVLSMRDYLRSKMNEQPSSQHIASVIPNLIPLNSLRQDVQNAELSTSLIGRIYTPGSVVSSSTTNHPIIPISSFSDPLFLALMSGYTPNHITIETLEFQKQMSKNRDIEGLSKFCHQILKEIIVLPGMKDEKRAEINLIRSYVQTKPGTTPTPESCNAFFRKFDLLRGRTHIMKSFTSTRAALSSAQADCFEFIADHERDVANAFLKQHTLDQKDLPRFRDKLKMIREAVMKTKNDKHFVPRNFSGSDSAKHPIQELLESISGHFSEIGDSLSKANALLFGEIELCKRVNVESNLLNQVDIVKIKAAADEVIQSFSEKASQHKANLSEAEKQIAKLMKENETLRRENSELTVGHKRSYDEITNLKQALYDLVDILQEDENIAPYFDDLSESNEEVQDILSLCGKNKEARRSL